MNQSDKLLFQLVKWGCKDDNGECRYCYCDLNTGQNEYDPAPHSDWCVFMEAFKYLVNRDLEDEITIGECYEPAMWIVEPETATKYLESLVKRAVRVHGLSEDEAISCEKGNIGYYSGYFDPITARRCHELFGAVHPIFGTSIVAPKEAYEAGLKLADNDAS